MPRNGSGVYSLPQAPFVSGTVISSAAVNSDLSDIASALTGSLPRDGQAGMIGALLAANGSSIAPSIAFTNDPSSGFYSPATGEIGVVIEGTQIGIFSSTGSSVPSSSGVPVGSVIDYAGTTIPTTWYQCYGQAVSRTTYALLFTAIGVTYGSGDGATTFNLPDARGSILVASDNMGGTAAGRLTTTYFGTDPTVIGDRGGNQTATLTLAQLPGGITSTGTASVTDNTGYIRVGSTTGGGWTNFSSVGGGSQVWHAASPGSNLADTASPTSAGSASVTSNNTSGNPHGIIQPSLIVNKIIYAGA
jgi:microcystin-dependent protein